MFNLGFAVNQSRTLFGTILTAPTGAAAVAVWWWRCSQGPAGVRA